MAIVAKGNSGDFTPAPEGLYSAVCVDVVDKGMVTNEFGTKHKVQLRWMLNEMEPKTGKPFLVMRQFTNSIHKKATLCQVLETWRGRAFTDEERQGFDLEKLIGAPCQLQVVHNRVGGDVYANVQAVIPLAKGMPRMAIPHDYIRVQDRDPKGPGHAAPHVDDDEEDIPF